MSTTPFYQYDIIAKTGELGITTIEDSPSINDTGFVAFVGRRATETDVFAGYGNASKSLIDVTGTRGSPNTSKQVQINNQNIIATHDLKIVGENATSAIRLRDANKPGATLDTNFVNVATTSGSVFDFFDAVFTTPNINNKVNFSSKNDVVFPGIIGSNRVLATPSLLSFNTTPLGTSFVRPMIADSGDIVYQTRFGTESFILITNRSLDKFDEIASPAKGFTVLGNSPGISDDGKFITFYGDLSSSGATTLQTNPGPGIFASVKTDNIWKVKRLAGIGGNGFLDPGETFVDANKNGKFDSGETDIGPFASFDANARVGVSSIKGTSISGKPPVATATYMGFDTSGKKGIYTTSFVNQPSAFTVSNPLLTVKIGQTINDLPSTVTDLNIYDPINNLGEIAFWASLSDGSQAIVTATQDTDGDGLIDLWETQGIDINEDGIIDLNLPALGADPFHKDLFVEVDAMTGLAPVALGTPLPDVPATLNGAKFATGTVLDRVISAFLNAPAASVKNPDGTKGIRLHIDLSDINMTRQPWADNPWGEFDNVKKAYFGTGVEKADPNKLAAKKDVYRYAIFADSFKGSTSGLAELPGNDFMVTLGDPIWTNSYTPSERADNQASTFMHELGHTLNLRHGGDDDINYKPNYYSVMNYTWQTRNDVSPLPPTATPAQQAAYDLFKKFTDSWKLDYSNRKWNSLDENALNEKNGIAGESGVYVPVGLTNPTNKKDFTPLNIVSSVGSADFNKNGLIDPTSYVLDINWQNARPDKEGTTQLNSYDDWANIRYRLHGKDFADGVHTTSNSDDEITAEEAIALREGLQKFINDYNIIPANNPPIATDDTATTSSGVPVTIDVLTNDSDIDRNPISLSVFSPTSTQGGSIIRDDNDTPNDFTDDRLIYTPATGFTGTDNFSYTISDGIDSATANVIVTVRSMIVGTDGNDILNGTAADDSIDGKLGDDRMSGGAGNDLYIVDSIRDVVVEGANQGIDTVRSSVNHTLTNNVENLSLTGNSHINGTGNALNNVITGNNGNNLLKGLAGNDTIQGAGGSDTLVGGAGDDLLIGDTEADRFLFGSGAAFTTTGLGVDTITDFISGTDKIALSKATFTALTSAINGALQPNEFIAINEQVANQLSVAGNSSAKIVYNALSGDLFYNQNGAAAGLGTGGLFASLNNKPSLVANDLFVQT